MDINKFYANENEKPLDNLIDDGGFCSIFRTIGCIGDSLSSGEFEVFDENKKRYCYDCFEYSWGQYIARACGSKVYNFSKGGMSASWYCRSFAEEMDFWNPDKRCQAYIIALGVNDISFILNGKTEFGSFDDIDFNDYHNNKDTFIGNYAKIIQRYKEINENAKFFIMTMPREDDFTTERQEVSDKVIDALRTLAEKFDGTYLIDLNKYAPVYDKKFKQTFYLTGHMNPMGYVFTAKMVMSYIDYIIRHNMKDFIHVWKADDLVSIL